MAKINKAYLRKLKTAYMNRQLVPFIGAGLSKPFGMPGWDKLILDLQEDYHITISQEKMKELRILLEEYKFLEAVEKIKELGIREEDIRTSICQAIREEKQSRKEEPDNLYKDLAKMNCTKYLTTNYDNYLSDYIGKRSKDISLLYEEIINEIDGEIYNNAVFNLHGDFEIPSSIILSKESYDKLYYNNQKYREVLEHFRKRYTLLFIGVSLEDKYIQEVLEASKGNLKARHFIITSNINQEKQKRLEEKYNLTIIEYKSKDGNHTEEIREILKEITTVDEEVKKQFNLSSLGENKQILNLKSHSLDNIGSENSLIFKDTSTLPNKDSIIYERIKETTKLQKEGYIKEAIDEYNKILQDNIFEPLSINEKMLVIKGLLYCHITNRDYDNAKPLVERAKQFPKSDEEADILSFMIDYYINIKDLESAFNITSEWHEELNDNIYVSLLYYYTKFMHKDSSFDDVANILLTEDLGLKIPVIDDNQKQFAYRLAGELAIIKNKYDEAIILLRKAYEVEDNKYNTEDLGLAYYSKALEKADNGSIIKIDRIDFNILSKAVEYFEIRFIKDNDDNKEGAYSRIAIPYMRSLFYLGNAVRFDEMYTKVKKYCWEDIYEIKRMKAINNIWLNKFNEKDVEELNIYDKTMVLADFYIKNGMFDHAIKNIEDLLTKKDIDNEEIFIQLLGTCLNAKRIDKFDKYHKIYLEKWKKSENIKIVKSLYHEIHGQLIEAEEELKELIVIDPSAKSHQLLIGFYTRNNQMSKVTKVYEEIIRHRQNLIDIDSDGFYITYHDHLIKNHRLKKALQLYDSVKDKLSSDTISVMEIRLKMVFGDYSNITELSLELFEKDDFNSIHIYNAAVGHLFHNEFEKSRHYINLYKSKGFLSKESLLSAERVENRLDILENKINVDKSKSVNYLKCLVNRMKLSNYMLNIPPEGSIVVEIIALYFLASINSLNVLDKYKEVLITYSTIEKLHDTYCYCGDQRLLEIINYIKKAKNIKLRSPSFDSIANNTELFLGEFPFFYDSLNLANEEGYMFVRAYDMPKISRQLFNLISRINS